MHEKIQQDGVNKNIPTNLAGPLGCEICSEKILEYEQNGMLFLTRPFGSFRAMPKEIKRENISYYETLLRKVLITHTNGLYSED